MAIGRPLDEAMLDNAISQSATQLHQINRTLADTVVSMSGRTASDFVAGYGYTVKKGDEIKKWFDAIGNLLQNAQGLGIIADGVLAPKATVENAKYTRFGS